MREIGVIRYWDLNLLAGVEGHDCVFVGAWPYFTAAARREQHVVPVRLA